MQWLTVSLHFQCVQKRVVKLVATRPHRSTAATVSGYFCFIIHQVVLWRGNLFIHRFQATPSLNSDKRQKQFSRPSRIRATPKSERFRVSYFK